MCLTHIMSAHNGPGGEMKREMCFGEGGGGRQTCIAGMDGASVHVSLVTQGLAAK